MPKLRNFVVASFAMAVMLGGSLSVAAGTAGSRRRRRPRARRPRHSRIECVDGTQGRGQVSEAGLVSVSYRRARPGRGATRPRQCAGAGRPEICLAWKQFDGGGNGCYPVSEEAARPLPAQQRPAVVRHQREIAQLASVASSWRRSGRSGRRLVLAAARKQQPLVEPADADQHQAEPDEGQRAEDAGQARHVDAGTPWRW